jgi:hypothetical protein
MGNNQEIRQRMETYRSVLLVLNWIGAVILIIVGIVLANSRYTQGIGIGVIIGSIVIGVIGHFLINVTLAIPFILLNNGDYLAAIVPEGKIIKSALTSGEQKDDSLEKGITYEVTANTFLRGSPSNDAFEKEPLKVYDKVIMKNTSNDNPDWFYVKTIDGKEGWVYSVYLKKC